MPDASAIQEAVSIMPEEGGIEPSCRPEPLPVAPRWTHVRVVDLETTGFDPATDRVVEVAYCDLISTSRDLVGGAAGWEVVGGRGYLCDPGRAIPPTSSAIHHIVAEDLAGALPFEAVLPAITCGLKLFAAHTAKMERGWITDELTGGAAWIDTYKAALRLYPEAPGHSVQALRYWLSPIGLDRRTASPAHRAYPDAYSTAFLLRDMLELATAEQLIEWSGQPALQVICRIGAWRDRKWSEVDDGFLEWVLSKDFDEDVVFTVVHEMERREKLRREANGVAEDESMEGAV